MALVYIRKVFPHDLTHEVRFTTYIHTCFLNSRYHFTFTKGGTTTYDVRAYDATDFRFGGDFKCMLPFTLKVGDFIRIEKRDDKYDLSIVLANSSEANKYNSLLGVSQRHLLFSNGVLIYKR